MTSLDTRSAQKFARDFEDVFYQGDYRGMAAVYTADAKLFAEGAPVVEGRPAIEEFWKQGCERDRLARMKRSIQTHGARASGDLGYSQSTVPLEIDGQPAKILIRGVCVWRREPDGIWRITHDISNRGEQRHPGEQPYGVAIGHRDAPGLASGGRCRTLASSAGPGYPPCG